MKGVSFQLERIEGDDARRFAITSEENGIAFVASRCFGKFRQAADSALANLTRDADEDDLLATFDSLDDYAREYRPRGYFPAVVMAAVDHTRKVLRITQLGDARAYLLRQNALALRPGPPAPQYSPDVILADGSALICLTYDQSTACELVELGLVDRAEGRRRARRPILTHFLGAEPATRPDVFSIDLVAGDRVLLCTSELWLDVDDRTIALTLQRQPLASEALAELAGDAGQAPLALIDCVTGSQQTRAPKLPTGVAHTSPVQDQAPQSPSSDGVLGQLGRDLSAWVADKPPATFVGREQQLRELMRSLMRMRKANVLLVGDPGVGKTWLVEALAARLVSGPCPPALRGKRVIELSMGALLSGTRYRGDFEGRIESILAQAAADPDLILFIDEVHLALQSGSTSDGSMDAANLLKPALARGELKMIGATTTREFDRHVARDEAFLRRFEVMHIDEPSESETRAILSRIADELENHHGLHVGDEAITAAIELSRRHLVDRRLPDKAIDLLDQACTRAASRWMSMSLTVAANTNARAGAGGSSVQRMDVAAVVARRCGIPIDLVLLDDKQRLNKLEDLLNQRIIGQEPAIALAANAIKNSYAGLKHPNKPVASLLFVGPTGVGKTALARGIAELVFSDEGAMIRLDMSEYMEKHAVARLLGAAPGYVGHEEGGQLSAPLRARPGVVVLFDEIEKAHPDVLQLLLQILDNGSLRDARGDELSFRDAIIILTSNLQVRSQTREIGFGSTANAAPTDDRAVREQLQTVLRPELLGRLSSVVAFTTLPEQALARIADNTLQQLLERVLSGDIAAAPPRSLRKNIHAKLSASSFGARDIERLVEAEVGRWLSATRQRDNTDAAVIVPGAIIVDRLPKDRRTSVAMVHIESTAELATARTRLDRQIRTLVDDIVGSALGVELRYLQYAARGVLGVFGGVHSATQFAASLDDSWRCVVHWGRIERDSAGRPSGLVVDELLELARTVTDRCHVTAAANEQLGVTEQHH